ncbi:MAG: translation initiation factor IF-2 subunit beta [Candidatus Bathyarchaeia archaeon]
MSDEKYNGWLDRLYATIPTKASEASRFEVPVPISVAAGNRTFIQNFHDICQALSRDQQHFVKYLAKELATAGSIEGEQAVFQGKFSHTLIKRIIDDYVQEYVLCPVCHSPDTKIVKEDRFRFLVCEACGAQSSVRVV